MRRQNKHPSKDKASHFFLESWSGLQEYVTHRPESIIGIQCPPKDMSRLQDIIGTKLQNIPLEKVVDQGLKVFVQVQVHDEVELEQSNALPNVVLALDHITDTRNFGAILRSAAFFGVNTVIVPNKRQAPITQGTIETCQGALVYTDVYSVVNLTRTLHNLKEQGYWIVGTDMGGQPLELVAGKFEKIVVVMGSEEKGLSRLVRKECDVIVSIQGAAQGVESLNVAVASGVFLQYLTRPFLTS